MLLSGGCLAESYQYDFDCQSAPVNTRFSILGREFIVPADFIVSPFDDNTYVYPVTAEPVFGPGLEYDAIAISIGSVSSERFDLWPSRRPIDKKNDDILIKERVTEAYDGSKIYETVLIANGEFLLITTVYIIDPMAIMRCAIS
jgi:hypothetical protein